MHLEAAPWRSQPLPSVCGLRIKSGGGGGPAPQVTWVGVWQDAGGTPADQATAARSCVATHGRAPQGPLWRWLGMLSFRMAGGSGGHRWTVNSPPDMAETKRDLFIQDTSPRWLGPGSLCGPFGGELPSAQTNFFWRSPPPHDPDPDTKIKVCTVISRSLTGSAVTPKPASTALNRKDEKP